MDEANRRIVSNERIDLIRAYERETSYRGRTVAASNLWQSLPPHTRNLICKQQGHHCGFWLQEQLAASDEKLGLPPLSPTARNSLRALLLREKGSKGRPPRDVSVVWKWLDDGEVDPGQLKRLFGRVDDLMTVPGAEWEASLHGAKGGTSTENRSRPKEAGKPSQAPPKSTPEPRPRKKAKNVVRGSVEKTLQFAAFKKVLDDAPAPRDLPIPPGVEALTYRQAYGEMLENVRVVLEVAGRDFGSAKRRYRSTEISLKAGAVAKACRTLRVTVPPPGQPVDEFNSRRKWLEIVKAYHPDRNAGDTSKVQIFDAANKALDVIKEYNRGLTSQNQEEAKTHVDEQQGTA